MVCLVVDDDFGALAKRQKVGHLLCCDIVCVSAAMEEATTTAPLPASRICQVTCSVHLQLHFPSAPSKYYMCPCALQEKRFSMTCRTTHTCSQSNTCKLSHGANKNLAKGSGLGAANFWIFDPCGRKNPVKAMLDDLAIDKVVSNHQTYERHRCEAHRSGNVDLAP